VVRSVHTYVTNALTWFAVCRSSTDSQACANAGPSQALCGRRPLGLDCEAFNTLDADPCRILHKACHQLVSRIGTVTQETYI